MAVASPVHGEPSCPVAQIGEPCTGGVTTCVQATCSKTQPDGGYADSVCGVCTYVGGVYCLPADVDMPCGDGGICTFQGGSSGASDGSGAIQSYGLQTCNVPVDGGGGGSLGTMGPSCPPEDNGMRCDGGGVCMIYGGSASSGSQSVSFAACFLPGSGSSSGSISTSSASSGAGTAMSYSSGGSSSSSSGAGSSTGSASSSTGSSSSGASSSGRGSSSGGGGAGSGSSGGGSGNGSASSSGDVGLDSGSGLGTPDSGASDGARGSGGCSVGPAGPSGILGWLAMVSVTALLWRRRSC